MTHDAVRRFTDEIKRGLATPERWLPSLFHSGHEYVLFLNGDSAKTRLQMLPPLALTDEDVPNGTCSVYAVLEVWKLPGEDVCDKSKTTFSLISTQKHDRTPDSIGCGRF